MKRLFWIALIGTLLAPAAARAQSEEVVYYHTDAIGSVRMVTNESGVSLGRYDYTPFGQPWEVPATNPDVRQFAGKELDDTLLNYLGARYYDSQTGRFTTVDPVLDSESSFEDPQRWNRYAYVRNGPLRYTDPDGRILFDFQEFKANLAEALRFGQDGYGYLVPAVAGIAAIGSAAGDALIFTGGAVNVIKTVVTEGGNRVISNAVDNTRGTIYKVPGNATSSQKPYIGRHNKPDPAKTRRSNDGRDRSQAEVIDTYDVDNPYSGRVKEQQHIDSHGLANLDNKRNEIRKQ